MAGTLVPQPFEAIKKGTLTSFDKLSVFQSIKFNHFVLLGSGFEFEKIFLTHLEIEILKLLGFDGLLLS